MPILSKRHAPNKLDTILMVADDVLLRSGIADYLRQCGYRVLEAAYEQDAIAFLIKEPDVDIVLAAVHANDKGRGFKLAHWIRANRPGTDLILTSGIEKTAGKAGDICDEGRRSRPYRTEQLIRQIKIRAEKRRAHQQSQQNFS